MQKYIDKFQRLEPITCNRFFVTIEPNSININSYEVRSVELPKLIFDTEKNELKWANIKLTILNTIAKGTIYNDIIKWAKGTKLNCPTIKIETLDPVGIPIFSWTISDYKIVGIDFGKCDYGSNELLFTEIIIEPANCELQTP